MVSAAKKKKINKLSSYTCMFCYYRAGVCVLLTMSSYKLIQSGVLEMDK